MEVRRAGGNACRFKVNRDAESAETHRKSRENLQSRSVFCQTSELLRQKSLQNYSECFQDVRVLRNDEKRIELQQKI